MPGIVALGKHFFFFFLKEPAHRVRDRQNRVLFNAAAESPLSVPFPWVTSS
jgi:hypothetical protein